MATNESFVFAGTEWNDFTNFRIQAFDPGIAPKRWNWIQGADSDGALAVEESHFDNAEMTLRVRITQQTSMDAALTKIGTLIDALQEAEKNPLGSPVVWTPAGSTKSVTGYVLGGEVTGLPIELSGDDAGWFVRAPVLTIKLIRRPFWYGAEVTVGSSTSTAPLIEYLVAGVTGDVPAEARLIVTDNATQNRRHVEWGLQQRHYDAGTSLIVDSDSLVTTGFGGTGTTRSGAYDPGAAGNSVIRGTLTNSPVAVCGTGNLSHIGTFRVKARVYAVATSDSTSDDFKVRLSWKEGDGPLRSNDYTSPVLVSGWSEVDLGLISIPEKTLGTQRWTGQIEAYSEDAGDTLDVDYIVLIPTGEGYGKARAISHVSSFDPVTAYNAYDTFDQAAGSLTAKTLTIGGTWTGAGDADDFTVDTTGHTAQRTAINDSDADTGRFVTAGTSLTDTIVQVDFKASVGGTTYQGVVARYTNTSNLFKVISGVGVGLGFNMTVQKRVAGVTTTLYQADPSFIAVVNTYYTIRLVVGADGQWGVWHWPTGGTPLLQATGYDAVLAPGATLASGTTGIEDACVSAVASTRNYDNFFAAAAPADAVAYSGRAAEIRHDSAIRQDSTGTYYGPVPSYRGSRFLLPCAGSAARTTRLGVKVRRNDLDVTTDDQIADSTTVQVKYTPRYVAVPR